MGSLVIHSTFSRQASRFATRRPDFEGDQDRAFRLFYETRHDAEANPDAARKMFEATARWEQWEKTHEVSK